MTLTLEISPEVERELLREAEISGLAMEVIAAQWMEAEKRRKREAHLAAVERACGMFAGRGRTVDDFLADRHAESEAEYDKWVEGQKPWAERAKGEGA